MVKKKTGESKYVQIIQQQGKKTPALVPLLLFIKVDSTANEFYYLFTFFLRFVGFIIICGNFAINKSLQNDYLSISIIFRYLTSYKIAEQFKMTNFAYNIISLLLFILSIVFIFFYYKTFRTIKKKIKLTKISTFKFQIMLDHLIFLVFPLVIEFLSFIYYIEFLDEKFIIHKNSSSYLNVVNLILNSISIIFYNFQAFLHILCENDPVNDDGLVKTKYGKNKLIILCIMQNIIMIECLELYLSEKNLMIYKVILNIGILIFLVCLYIDSYNKYNYENNLNYFINIMSIFCFYSIVFDIILSLLDYKIETYDTLVFYTICKIIISFFFDHLNKTMYNKRMIFLLQDELFKVYDNYMFRKDTFDVLWYFYDIVKKVHNSPENINLRQIINVILLHQSKCHNNECKCRYINIFPKGKKYTKIYINNFMERINFILESIFVKIDYLKNYELTLLLAEHFYNYNNNPILSYSIIQTILYFHTESLQIDQVLILFTALHKYIDKCNNILTYEKLNDPVNINQIILDDKQTKLYKSIYQNYKYLIKVQKVIKKYAIDYLQVLKFKENMEETVEIVKDENNEILKIKSYYLSTKNLSNIINILLGEIDMNNNLISYLKTLDPNKIPVSLIYKCFLFAELFLCGKLPKEVMSLMYSFSNERNLYTEKIQPGALAKIKNKYIEKHVNGKNFYIIFKFNNGMNIHYFDEVLSKKLGFIQKDLLGFGIEKILPKDIIIPHEHAVIRYLINQKHRVFNNLCVFIFDRDMHMHYFVNTGVCMPGLGKYLFCIINCYTHDNPNIYYIFLNKHFDWISISSNFLTKKKISLHILNKLKIKAKELFNLKDADFEKFKAHIDEIDDYNNYLEIKTDLFYAQKLFKEKSKYHSRQSIFQLSKIYKVNNNNFYEEKTELQNDEYRLINIETLFNHENKINIKKIKNDKVRFRLNGKAFAKKINELIARNSENEINTKIYNFLENEGDFYGEYGLTLIYNTYYYEIKMEEIFSEKITDIKNLNRFSKSLSIHANKVGNNKKITTFLIKDKEENNQNKEETVLIQSNNIVINKVKLYDYVTFFVIVILTSLFIVYVYILVYQKNMVSSNRRSFMMYYYNFYQRDMLNELYSCIFSSYFHYMNLTNYTDIMKEQDYIDLLSQNSDLFQDGYHQFYEVYITYKSKENGPIHLIFDKQKIYKIASYFTYIEYDSEYTLEAEYISFTSKLSSMTDLIEDIVTDSKVLFLGKFLEEPYSENKTNTYYIRTLYYLCKNYYTLFYKIFEDLESEVTLEFTALSNKSKITYLALELLGFCIILLFFVIVLIFLHQTNQAIFRNILNMYIDFNQKDNFSYKNKKVNLSLMKVISGFIVLINDFNLENLDKLNSIIRGKAVQMKEDSSEYSKFLGITNIYNKEDIYRSSGVFASGSSENNSGLISSSTYNNKNKVNLMLQKIENKNNNNELNDNNNSTNSFSNSKILLNSTSTDNIKSLNTKNQLLKESKINNFNPLGFEIKTNLLNKNKGMEKKKSLHINKFQSQDQLNPNKNNNSKNSINNNNYKDDSSNDENKMTIEIFVKKMENNGLKQVKMSKIVLFAFFLFAFIYVTAKIIISLDFIGDIKSIFEDFGVLAYRYSLIFYYFNSLRLLIIIPQFGDEKIFQTMGERAQNIDEKMNNFINFKMTRYTNVCNFYSHILEKNHEEIVKTICENDLKCNEIMESKRYNLFSQGLKIAVPSTVSQISNIYKDYEKSKSIINDTDIIIKLFINNQFEQIDMNLNYVYSNIQRRIFQVFLEDLNSLVSGFNSKITALNICAFFYCFIVAFTTLFFIIYFLRRITVRIEEATVRINNTFCYMVKTNSNRDNKDDN